MDRDRFDSQLDDCLCHRLCGRRVANIAQPDPFQVGAWYVEIFRNIPLLVQLFIWFNVIPELLPVLGHGSNICLHFGRNLPAQRSASGLFTAARIAEQVRSGLRSLGKGQYGAGLALGLNIKQVYLLVLLPVAYRIIIPTLTSEFLNLIKNSAVASTIGFVELARRSDSMAELKSTVFEALLAGTLLYGAINLIVLFFSRGLERSTKLPGLVGAKK